MRLFIPGMMKPSVSGKIRESFEITVPLELNEKELRHRENAGSEMIVYGRLPLMHSASVYERILSAAMDRRRGLF